MKITSARTESFSAIRRRALTEAAGSSAARAVVAADTAGFLGLSEADLTPQVQQALKTLMVEIDDLRGEVAHRRRPCKRANVIRHHQDVAPAVISMH